MKIDKLLNLSYLNVIIYYAQKVAASFNNLLKHGRCIASSLKGSIFPKFRNDCIRNYRVNLRLSYYLHAVNGLVIEFSLLQHCGRLITKCSYAEVPLVIQECLRFVIMIKAALWLTFRENLIAE